MCAINPYKQTKCHHKYDGLIRLIGDLLIVWDGDVVRQQIVDGIISSPNREEILPNFDWSEVDNQIHQIKSRMGYGKRTRGWVGGLGNLVTRSLIEMRRDGLVTATQKSSAYFHKWHPTDSLKELHCKFYQSKRAA